MCRAKTKEEKPKRRKKCLKKADLLSGPDTVDRNECSSTKENADSILIRCRFVSITFRVSRKMSRNWNWRSDKRRHQLPTVMSVWIGLLDGKCLVRVGLSLVVLGAQWLNAIAVKSFHSRSDYAITKWALMLRGLHRSALPKLESRRRSFHDWRQRFNIDPRQPHDANSKIRSHVLYELLPEWKTKPNSFPLFLGF